jgi:glucokinase
MAYRLALDVGAAATTLALIEGSGPTVAAYERPNTETIFAEGRPPAASLCEAVSRFLAERRVELSEILGIGVGIPGIVDRQSGTVLSCPNLRVLDGAPLGSEATSQLGVPVCVANNTNLIALGEHTAGLGQGIDDMAAVSVGSGIGCGLILQGRLYEGFRWSAGEFGHMIVVPNGLACSCGAHGCLEMYCSAKALDLVALLLFPEIPRTAITRWPGAHLLIEQASAGHVKAAMALFQAFTYLGVGLVNLVNLLNPRLIVLGGGIVFAWPEGVEVARQVVLREALPQARKNLRMEISHLQSHAGVLGGAALVSATCAPAGK